MTDNGSPCRLLYIAGRGHSGSTMLDAILGNSPNIESVGELVSGMGRYDDYCSCGDLFGLCGYWSEIRRQYELLSKKKWAHAVELTVSQAHITNFLKTLFSGSGDGWVHELISVTEKIREAVCGDKKILVDSSKEVTRALFLIRFMQGAKVVHLVRDPRCVMLSNYKRLKSGVGFVILRHRYIPKYFFLPFILMGILGWVVGNVLMHVVQLFGRKNVLLVRYEDLMMDLKTELRRIGAFIDVPLGELIIKYEHSDPFLIKHNIGGNGMRMKKTFLIDPNNGKCNAPGFYSLLVSLLCWPLMLLYGYRPFVR